MSTSVVMPEHNLPDPVFIDRYLAGEADASESERMVEAVGGREVVRAGFDASAGPVNVAADWKALNKKLFVVETGNSKASRMRRNVLPAGALVVGAVLLGVFIYAKDVLHTSKLVPSTAQVAKRYSTMAGQRSRITLADGSAVVLAPATTISVSGRNVDIVGEAVFTVHQNAGSPFIVKAGGTVTRVLGTTFGVRRYSTDSSVRVVVADGRVAVASAVLSARDLVSVTDTSIHVSHNANVDDILAWASSSQPRLVFQNTPVPEVLAQLERWYNVKFVGMDDELKDARLSSVVKDPQLTQPTLALLGAALGRQLERRGQTIYLSTP